MAAEVKKEIALEIAHVLFVDIVGYSKLLIDEQSEALQELNQIVRNTESARAADAARSNPSVLPKLPLIHERERTVADKRTRCGGDQPSLSGPG